MIKNKSFLLLVLFSLFALNSNDHKHENYERKRSLPEKVIKTVMVGFILAHISPAFVSTFTKSNFVLDSKDAFVKDLIQDFKKGRNSPILKDIFSIPKKFAQNSYNAPTYILAVASAQALTALLLKPIF